MVHPDVDVTCADALSECKHVVVLCCAVQHVPGQAVKHSFVNLLLKHTKMDGRHNSGGSWWFVACGFEYSLETPFRRFTHWNRVWWCHNHTSTVLVLRQWVLHWCQYNVIFTCEEHLYNQGNGCPTMPHRPQSLEHVQLQSLWRMMESVKDCGQSVQDHPMGCCITWWRLFTS